LRIASPTSSARDQPKGALYHSRRVPTRRWHKGGELTSSHGNKKREIRRVWGPMVMMTGKSLTVGSALPPELTGFAGRADAGNHTPIHAERKVLLQKKNPLGYPGGKNAHKDGVGRSRKKMRVPLRGGGVVRTPGPCKKNQPEPPCLQKSITD